MKKFFSISTKNAVKSVVWSLDVNRNAALVLLDRHNTICSDLWDYVRVPVQITVDKLNGVWS